MSSILRDLVALDTNVYVLGIRRSPQRPGCATLLFEHLPSLHVYLPVRVIAEVHRKLRQDEQQAVYSLLGTAAEVDWDFSSPPHELIGHYEQLGAKKGDAVIAAHLHAAGIRWLVSENRHFLAEIPDLPFTVITSAEALSQLADSD